MCAWPSPHSPGFMAAADLCDENFGYESVPAFREAELLEEPGERDPALRIAKYDESLTDADFKPDILSGTSVWALRVAAITYKRSLAT